MKRNIDFKVLLANARESEKAAITKELWALGLELVTSPNKVEQTKGMELLKLSADNNNCHAACMLASKMAEENIETADKDLILYYAKLGLFLVENAIPVPQAIIYNRRDLHYIIAYTLLIKHREQLSLENKKEILFNFEMGNDLAKHCPPVTSLLPGKCKKYINQWDSIELILLLVIVDKEISLKPEYKMPPRPQNLASKTLQSAITDVSDLEETFKLRPSL